MIKTIRSWFTSKKEPIEETAIEIQEREMRELLRENLILFPTDIFYIDDPKVGVPPDKLVDYYRKFYDICRDKDVMERIKYLINRQARMTMESANKSGTLDALGGVNINGMATVRDDFIRMANSYLKEVPNVEHFNKHNVFNQL